MLEKGKKPFETKKPLGERERYAKPLQPKQPLKQPGRGKEQPFGQSDKW